jgi:hypothetical protein
MWTTVQVIHAVLLARRAPMLEQICSIAPARMDIPRRTKHPDALTLMSALTELRELMLIGIAQLITKESAKILLADMTATVMMGSSGTPRLDDVSILMSAPAALRCVVNSLSVQTNQAWHLTTRKDTHANAKMDIMDLRRLAPCALTRTSALTRTTRRVQVRLSKAARTWSYMRKAIFTTCHLCAPVPTDTGMDVPVPMITHPNAATAMNAAEKVSTHVQSLTKASVKILPDHTSANAMKAMKRMAVMLVWIRKSVTVLTHAMLMPLAKKRKADMIACVTPDMKETDVTVTISMSVHLTRKFAVSVTARILQDHSRAIALTASN